MSDDKAKKKPITMSTELRTEAKIEALLEKSGLSLQAQARALSHIIDRKVELRTIAPIVQNDPQQRQG